jgi:hypothetical protein
MEQHVFYYFNDYRGHHRKGVAIHTATEFNLDKKWFHSTKMYFLNTTERFKQENFI